jgi:LemA protein
LRRIKAQPTFAAKLRHHRFGAPALTRLFARLARVAVLIAVPLALAGCGINTIPTKDERAKAAWAEVQNQYQRRSDLIPNLVSTVQGFAAQEREVLVAVTEARASATQVQVNADTITDPEQFQRFAQAQNQLSGVLGRLMMIQERYPELKSNQNFLALQSQLEGTENRIAIARRDYNEAVRDYNTEIRTFPGAIWANTVHGWAEPMQTFEASASAQTAPTVTFEQPAAPAPAPLPAPVPAPLPAPAPAAEPAPAQ